MIGGRIGTRSDCTIAVPSPLLAAAECDLLRRELPGMTTEYVTAPLTSSPSMRHGRGAVLGDERAGRESAPA